MDRPFSRREDNNINNHRRDDRRPRDDTRSHNPRYEQTRSTRSRSPPRRDRRDDHHYHHNHRRRSPPPPRGPPPRSSSRDRDFPRNSRDSTAPLPSSRQHLKSENNLDIKAAANLKHEDVSKIKVEAGEDEGTEEEMQRVMGFKDFRSTKETKVPGNDRNYGVYKVKKTEYRQYMNRVGGFNRPLDAM